MFIHLTNANQENNGDPVALNKSLICSIFPVKYINPNDGLEYEITKIYCPPHGTWEVKEAYIDVLYLLNK
jgi:hypothetical protein